VARTSKSAWLGGLGSPPHTLSNLFTSSINEKVLHLRQTHNHAPSLALRLSGFARDKFCCRFKDNMQNTINYLFCQSNTPRFAGSHLSNSPHLARKPARLDAVHQQSTPRFAEQRTGGRSPPSSMSRHPKTTSYEPSSCSNPLTLCPILQSPIVNPQSAIGNRQSATPWANI
jgi:hypothetical protein